MSEREDKKVNVLNATGSSECLGDLCIIWNAQPNNSKLPCKQSTFASVQGNASFHASANFSVY